MTTSMASTTTAIRRLQVVRDSGIDRLPCWRRAGVREKVLPRRPPAEHAVDDRDEEERGEGGHGEPADHRAPQRSVLLAALAEPEGHRQHADDHGGAGQ